MNLLLFDESSSAALPSGHLQPLVMSGNYFALADGTPFTLIECTDFELLHWFLDGRDITPVLAQRRDCGYNCVRVWTCYDFNGPLGWWILLPSQRPEVYARLGEFAALCAAYGLYIELVAYTNVADLAHWDKLGRAIVDGKATNVIVEWRNEHSVVNGGCLMNPDAFSPLPGVLCSHGSSGVNNFPSVRPAWQYETCHYNVAYEWWRKVGHNTMELSRGAEGMPASHVPAIANENPRYPDNEQSTQRAYDAAAGGALLCAGSCFHSVHGKKSELWEGVELDAAKAWADGARSVDLRCQRGPYVHRQDLENANVMRAYEQPVDNAQCVVLIRYWGELMTDAQKVVTEPLPLVPVTIIGDMSDAVPTTGTIATTPKATQPNLVITVVTPMAAIAIRFANAYLTAIVGLVTAGAVFNDVLPAHDFASLVVTAAKLSLAGPCVALLKDLITVLGRLERTYPLLTGSV